MGRDSETAIKRATGDTDMAVKDIERNMDRWLEKLQSEIEVVHQVVAEEFVKNARANVTQTIYSRPIERKPWDLTGNLRSSIGYSLITPSRQLQGGFQGEGTKGKQEGKQLAMSLTSGHDYTLALVAGMEYAAAVESRGYDVITQAVKDAEKSMDKRLTSVYNRAIKQL